MSSYIELFWCGMRRRRSRKKAASNDFPDRFSIKNKSSFQDYPDKSRHDPEQISAAKSVLLTYTSILSPISSADGNRTRLEDTRSSQELRRDRARIRALSDSVQLNRERLDFDWAHLHEAYIALQKSEVQLLDALEVERPALSQAINERLQSLQATLSGVDKVRDAASYAQREISRVSEDLAKTVHDILGPHTSTDLPSRSSSIRSSTPSLLREYFDQFGAVESQREVMEEIDFEHIRDTTARELKKDQDRPLTMTDEQFTAEYEQRRIRAQTTLSESVQRLNALRIECESLGLDTEPQRRRRSLSSSSGAANSETIQWQTNHVLTESRPAAIGDYLLHDESRIQNWVRVTPVNPLVV